MFAKLIAINSYILGYYQYEGNFMGKLYWILIVMIIPLPFSKLLSNSNNYTTFVFVLVY